MIPIYEDEEYKISALAEKGYIVFELDRFEGGVVDPLNTEVIYDSRACKWEENNNIDGLPDKVEQGLLKEMV